MDIYALAPQRSAANVERFLARFAPNRERADAAYSVHVGNANSAATFDTPEAMAKFCEAHPEAEARAYWNVCSASGPRSAHVFFLPAGGLVLGLSVAATDELAWDWWLAELTSFAGTTRGYWTSDSPPEDTVSEFVAVAEEARRTRRCT